MKFNFDIHVSLSPTLERTFERMEEHLGSIAASVCDIADALNTETVSMTLSFLPPNSGGLILAKGTLRADDNEITAVLAFKDKHGNPAAPYGIPAWSLTDDSTLSMTVSTDGLQASFVPKGPIGTVSVNVTAEGDATPGVQVLQATGEIEVIPADAETVELAFNNPT